MLESEFRLNDEQVQRFIADGFIILDSGLPEEFHSQVTQVLDHSLKHESKWLGDNLLPRIPQLHQLQTCSVLDGAMRSLLGDEFRWAPHRFPHNSEPLLDRRDDSEFDPFENQPAMGEGSISGSGWHQDGHSKAGRSRWHTFKAINVFYFPQDVPLEMGPTRLLAGSHLFATLRNIVPSQVFYQPIKAGTMIIADFDVGHAGTPNHTDMTRYMLKFVALRTTNPESPSWHFKDSAWCTPDQLRTPTHIPRVWEMLWNWLQGRNHSEGSLPLPSSDFKSLLSELESPSNETRLSALYELVRFSELAVQPLLDTLLSTAGKGRHETPAHEDPGFYAMSPDHLERRFSRRQFVPEDSAIALGAIGTPAINPLLDLLQHDDPWIRINAVYAIGEIGNSVIPAHADRVGQLLEDDLHQVVRATADSLCWLDYSAITAERIGQLFKQSRPEWQDNAMGEPRLGGRWTIETQVRYGLAWALLSRASSPHPPSVLEDVMVAALPCESGYTPAVLCQGLDIIGTPSALRAAVRYLEPRRWDAASFAPASERKSKKTPAQTSN